MVTLLVEMDTCRVLLPVSVILLFQHLPGPISLIIAVLNLFYTNDTQYLLSNFNPPF